MSLAWLVMLFCLLTTLLAIYVALLIKFASSPARSDGADVRAGGGRGTSATSAPPLDDGAADA